MSDSTNYLEFNGKSGDNFIIPSIIQFLALLGKSGELTFTLDDNASAKMYLFDGSFTHTELNKLGGIDVISHMFCWGYGAGKFNFTSEYKGDKMLFKSLGTLNPQQILMRITQRIDECPHKEKIQSKFKSITSTVGIDKSIPNESHLLDPVKMGIISVLSKEICLPVSELITNVFPQEIPSCRAFHELLENNILVNADNWEKHLTQQHLLDTMNVVAGYTDQTIALKFLANHKESMQLTSDKPVTIKKLKILADSVREEFLKLLPQGKPRWNEMYNELNKHINNIDRNFKMKKVVSHPDIMEGKPHLVGTKITVASILEKLSRKQSINQIARQFPQLDEEDVIIAIKYALNLVKEINTPKSE